MAASSLSTPPRENPSGKLLPSITNIATRSQELHGSSKAKFSSATAAQRWACAVTSPLTTPKRASSRGASTPFLAIPQNRSKALHSKRLQKAGAANGGSSAQAAPSGTPSSTTPSSTCSTSGPATGLRGTAAPGAQKEKTICSPARSSRSNPTPANTFGTTRKFPAMHGTTMPPRQSSLPTSQATGSGERFFFKLRRTDSFTYSIAPPVMSFPQNPTPRSPGRPESILRQVARLKMPTRGTKTAVKEPHSLPDRWAATVGTPSLTVRKRDWSTFPCRKPDSFTSRSNTFKKPASRSIPQSTSWPLACHKSPMRREASSPASRDIYPRGIRFNKKKFGASIVPAL